MSKLLVLCGVALAGLSAMGCGPSAHSVDVLMPDLDQRPPSDLVVEASTGGGYILRFESAADNRGTGPMTLEARRARGDETMTADQVLLTSGAPQRRAAVAELHYDEVRDHGHWHYREFMTFELLDLEGQVVRTDVKSGFCLVDSYDSDPDTVGPGEPSEPEYRGNCGRGSPGLLEVSAGISAGYGDRYSADLDDQWIDLTGLEAGRYQFVHTANPEHALAESDYENNAASILIELRWPGGPGAAPTVSVLRECPDEPACLPAE